MYTEWRVDANQPDVLQAPKLNDAQTQKEIEGITEILTRVDATMATRPAPHTTELLQAGQEESDTVELFRR